MARYSLATSFAKDSDQIIDRVVDDEALLIHLTSGNLFSLSTVGTSVWHNIDGRRTVENLVELITEEYDVDKGLATADVLRLVEQLADEGLIVPQQATETPSPETAVVHSV